MGCTLPFVPSPTLSRSEWLDSPRQTDAEYCGVICRIRPALCSQEFKQVNSKGPIPDQ